jgi:hypothetical protein
MSAGGEGEFIVAGDSVSIPFMLLPYPRSWSPEKSLIDSLEKYHFMSNRKMIRQRPLAVKRFNSIVEEFRKDFALQETPKLSCASFSVMNPNYNLIDTNEIFYLLYQEYLSLKERYCAPKRNDY